MQTIRDDLAQIVKAGQALAEAQFPIYVTKQTALRQAYSEMLRTTRKEEGGPDPDDDEDAKMETMGNAKRSAYLREKNAKRHVRAMTKAQRERNIANVMDGLFYGLDGDFPVQPEALVDTGNRTIDAVNRHMILCAMQRWLKHAHPETFQTFQPF